MDERDPREPQDDDVEEGLGGDEGVPEGGEEELDAMVEDEPDPDGEEDDASDTDAPRRKLPRYTIHELKRYEDALGRRFFYTPTGRAVCGRRRKRKNAVIEDEACMAGPTTQGPCRMHGAGSGAPMTAGGRYSKVLRSWRALFQESLADKDLLDTRNDLALMDTALAPLVQRAEDADCPAWRARVREAFTELEAAVKKKQHARVGSLMRALGTLIEEGARADEIVGDLMRYVDRRAARAHRINELEVRREATVSPGELVAIFGSWIELLRTELDGKVFQALLPRLQALATGPRPGVVGAAAEREVGVRTEP